MTKEEIIYEINSISLSKMKMLYTQVKSILDTKELQGSSNNQEEFEKKHEYLNYRRNKSIIDIYNLFYVFKYFKKVISRILLFICSIELFNTIIFIILFYSYNYIMNIRL